MGIAAYKNRIMMMLNTRMTSLTSRCIKTTENKCIACSAKKIFTQNNLSTIKI